MEFIVNHKHFTQALSEVSKAVSTKAIIPILSGIKITADQSGITLIASNSNIFIEKFIPSSNEDDQITTIVKAGTIVVPAKYFIEIIKKMPSLIPNDFQTVINIDRKKILQGVDRSNLLASDWANNNVNLEIINESAIKISSNASQIGKISETQQVDTIQGEKQLNISFDGRFMLDALKAIKEETVTLSFSGSMRPILIEAGSQSAAIHLISPVRAY
ncbi:hypothetical protein COD86_08485 [Bacillus cereus]|nr:hypothetical protein COD14_09420 [Bacillus cereus]PGV97226.1 hypothetical protein COD86_08485 [Bacillus cereus]